MRPRVPYRAVALATALMGAGAYAAAQIAEDEGGARAALGIDLRIEVDDGDPEFRTGFDLDLISATRTQRLRFSGDFGLAVPLDDPGQADFRDPRYALEYLRDTGRSQFSFSSSFTRREVDDRFGQDLDGDGDFDEDDVALIGGGTQESRVASLGLILGATDPVGAEFSYRYNERTFTGTVDPDLEDRRTDEFTAALRLDVDPTLRLRLTGSLRETDQAGLIPETDERRRIGLGAEWQARPDFGLNGEVAYSRIDREQLILGLPVVTERDGIDVSLGATLDRPGTQYSLDFSRLLNQGGFVRSAEVGARYTLPRDTTFEAAIGTTELPSGADFTTARLAYSRETRNGAMALSLSRDATFNSDDEEVQRTILQGSYSMVLPDDAQLGLSARLTESDFTLPATPDLSSTRLSVTYSRPMTEDWNLATGLSWQRTRQDGAAARTDERVFVGLERRFVFRR